MCARRARVVRASCVRACMCAYVRTYVCARGVHVCVCVCVRKCVRVRVGVRACTYVRGVYESISAERLCVLFVYFCGEGVAERERTCVFAL